MIVASAPIDIADCAAWVIEAHQGILTVEPLQSIQSWEQMQGVQFNEAQTAEIIRVVDDAMRMVPGDICGDDPIELRPVRALSTADLAQGGEVTLGYSWTVRDWLDYLAPWSAIGVVIGAVIVGLIWYFT